MNTQVVTIDPAAAADAAWTHMQRRRIRHLVVMADAELLGVLSERDLGGRNGADVRRGRNVGELMTPAPVSATPATTLRQAANLMRGRQIGSLPVIDGGQVVGIVTATDVLDELGRGSVRPDVRARRQSLRTPPAGARRAAAKQRAKRAAKREQSAGRPSVNADNAKPPPAPARGGDPRAPGSTRARQPDSAARAPLAAATARATKRTGARRSAAEIPAFIRATDPEVRADDREYLRRKLGRRLGKFAAEVQRVSVRIEDINGPRGGRDRQCRFKVTLRGLPSVVVQAEETSLQAAMDRALALVGNAVHRALQQRRTILRQPGREDRRAAASD